MTSTDQERAALQFLAEHSKWLADSWAMTPEGREYKVKFDLAIDAIRRASAKSEPAESGAVRLPPLLTDESILRIAKESKHGFDLAMMLAGGTVIADFQSALIGVVRAALAEQARRIEREGWQWVPKEPTEAMWYAGRDPIMFRDLGFYRPAEFPTPEWQIGPNGIENDRSKGTTAVHVWRAMLAASPQPQAEAPAGEQP